MLLNIAPPINSTMPQQAVEEYAALGHFIRSCYGEGAVASASALASTSCLSGDCASVKLTLGTQRTFDRVLLKEELSAGQMVLAYSLLADGVTFYNGTAIGRSQIVLLPANVTATTMELKVTAAKAPPRFRLVAVPDPAACSTTGPDPMSCNLLQDTMYVGIAYNTTDVSSVSACCSVCRADTKCAFFVAAPPKASPAILSCQLLSANQGERKAPGYISGSPSR